MTAGHGDSVNSLLSDRTVTDRVVTRTDPGQHDWHPPCATGWSVSAGTLLSLCHGVPTRRSGCPPGRRQCITSGKQPPFMDGRVIPKQYERSEREKNKFPCSIRSSRAASCRLLLHVERLHRKEKLFTLLEQGMYSRAEYPGTRPGRHSSNCYDNWPLRKSSLKP